VIPEENHNPARTHARQPMWLRVIMVLLAVPNIAAGLWAIIAPQHWFDTFPGWAPQLVAAFPPYNEHLATDAGSGLFASGVAMALAAWWPRREVVITAALAFLAFALPHFLWHFINPSDALTSPEDTVNDISLAAAVVGAGVVLMWQWHHSIRRPASPASPPTTARIGRTEGVTQ